MAAKRKTKKGLKDKYISSPLINKDITETIRSSYQKELTAQAQAVQSLKKTLKTLSSQLTKAMTKRRVLKKKRAVCLKKAGLNPRGEMKKQVTQATTDYQAAMNEIKTIQQAMDQTRQNTRLANEQVKKISAIIRSIQKMEKRWDKAIAAKFRAQKKKAKVAKKKKGLTATKKSSRGRPAKVKSPINDMSPLAIEDIIVVASDPTSES